MKHLKHLKRFATYNRIVNRLNFLRMRFGCKPFQHIAIYNVEYFRHCTTIEDLKIQVAMCAGDNGESELDWRWTDLKCFCWYNPASHFEAVVDNITVSQANSLIIKSAWTPWGLK